MCQRFKNPKAIQLQRKAVPLCCLPACLSGLLVTTCKSNSNLSHVATIAMLAIDACCFTAVLYFMKRAKKIENAQA